MLDGQRSQVGVRHQIPPCLAVREHLLKDCPVPLRGMNEAGTRLVQPALHSCQGLDEREGMLEDPGIGADADIRGNHDPAQADRVRSGQLGVPPGASLWMERAEGVFGVEQNVRVDQYQRASSPSSSANSSWILFRSTLEESPMGRGLVT